jgi:hypothetical protein
MALKKAKTSSQYVVAHKKSSLTYNPYAALDFLLAPSVA